MNIFPKKQEETGREKVIIVENVSNKYNDEFFLKNISFVVYKGEIFSIIGLSGSGKSTLLKTIVGLEKKLGGTISVLGNNIFFTRKMVGFSPQQDSFFSDLSISQNMELFSSMNGVSYKTGKELGKEYLKMLGMEGFDEKKPKELSGGQKKRLNIILSCLHSPKLLILDEPFAALDYYNRRILWDFLISLKNRGITIVLTTHLLNEAQEYSSRVLVLKNGKKFGYGTFNEIKEKIGFNYLLHIKMSHVANSFIDSLTHFCMLKKIRIVYNLKKELLFAVAGGEDKSTIEGFMKRNNQEFTEVEFRPPNLDEVILASR
ncbi:putative ABC transporter ATP-binding protein [Candidatus Tiddalikarchaeum anstoanum]|nr:putative ABC transporter ATP-binding protein [Candidatus Tiddalikarchaeum anstoanum]